MDANNATEKAVSEEVLTGLNINKKIQSKDEPTLRERWVHKADGMITLIGYSIGEGTLLKFPYLCARNGGGAFLLPFLIFTALCALPLYFLEMTIGQYYQTGPVEVWRLCPAMKGLGLGSSLISWIFAIYTPVYFSWYIYYFLHSFSSVIPWSNCNNDWNTDHCITTRNVTDYSDVTVFQNMSALTESQYPGNLTRHGALSNSSTAAEEFWRLNVLDITDGLEDVGSLRWPLVGCLTFTFACMYLILFKGIRVSGKVVYITFICPIVLITILFIRALMLPGAVTGLVYYIKPEFDKLTSPTIWLEACGFALHSMGTSTGITITMASHNKLKSNCFRDSLLIVFADAFITIYCGFAMFSVLGHMAWVKGVTLDHFQSGGFNIAFMVFPEAVTYLPLPQLWSVILFLMLMTLGLDSTVPCFEVAMAVVGDRFPRLTKRRWLMVAIVMLPMFFLSLVYVTQGGIYLLILTDWYCMVPPVLLFGVVQALVLAWCFGVDRLNKITNEMYGKHIHSIFKILIKFITPALLMVIFVYALYGYRPPKYGDYYYPEWATAVGWLMSVGVILPMPVWLVYSIWASKGDTMTQKIQDAFRPDTVYKEKHTDGDQTTEDALL